MNYELKNNTSEEITLSGVTLEPGVPLEIFNDETGDFEIALLLFQEQKNDLGVLITKGDVSFLIDGEDSGAPAFFAIVSTWDELLKGDVIPYLEKLGNAYFHLKENKLFIYNPLAKKWYSIQLSEVVSDVVS